MKDSEYIKGIHWGYRFGVPSAWWKESGLDPLPLSVTEYLHYRPLEGYHEDPHSVTLKMASDIAPVSRVIPGHRWPLFCASKSQRISAKERTCNILRGYVEQDAIPPVQVITCEGFDAPYMLVDGVHRTYTSIAAGFTHIPAVRVDERILAVESELPKWWRNAGDPYETRDRCMRCWGSGCPECGDTGKVECEYDFLG